MIKKKIEKVEVEQTIAISKQCDRCKAWYDVEEDVFESQEFHHIRFTGGYGSVFGDGTTIECDLCQKCLHTMIKDYMRSKNNE